MPVSRRPGSRARDPPSALSSPARDAAPAPAHDDPARDAGPDANPAPLRLGAAVTRASLARRAAPAPAPATKRDRDRDRESDPSQAQPRRASDEPAADSGSDDMRAPRAREGADRHRGLWDCDLPRTVQESARERPGKRKSSTLARDTESEDSAGSGRASVPPIARRADASPPPKTPRAARDTDVTSRATSHRRRSPTASGVSQAGPAVGNGSGPAIREGLINGAPTQSHGQQRKSQRLTGREREPPAGQPSSEVRETVATHGNCSGINQLLVAAGAAGRRVTYDTPQPAGAVPAANRRASAVSTSEVDADSPHDKRTTRGEPDTGKNADLDASQEDEQLRRLNSHSDTLPTVSDEGRASEILVGADHQYEVLDDRGVREKETSETRGPFTPRAREPSGYDGSSLPVARSVVPMSKDPTGTEARSSGKSTRTLPAVAKKADRDAGGSKSDDIAVTHSAKVDAGEKDEKVSSLPGVSYRLQTAAPQGALSGLTFGERALEREMHVSAAKHNMGGHMRYGERNLESDIRISAAKKRGLAGSVLDTGGSSTLPAHHRVEIAASRNLARKDLEPHRSFVDGLDVRRGSAEERNAQFVEATDPRTSPAHANGMENASLPVRVPGPSARTILPAISRKQSTYPASPSHNGSLENGAQSQAMASNEADTQEGMQVLPSSASEPSGPGSLPLQYRPKRSKRVSALQSWVPAADVFRKALPKVETYLEDRRNVPFRDMRGWIDVLASSDTALNLVWSRFLGALRSEDTDNHGDEEICRFVLQHAVKDQLDPRNPDMRQTRQAVNNAIKRELECPGELGNHARGYTFRDLFRRRCRERREGELTLAPLVPVSKGISARPVIPTAKPSGSARPPLGPMASSLESGFRVESGALGGVSAQQAVAAAPMQLSLALQANAPPVAPRPAAPSSRVTERVERPTPRNVLDVNPVPDEPYLASTSAANAHQPPSNEGGILASSTIRERGLSPQPSRNRNQYRAAGSAVSPDSFGVSFGREPANLAQSILALEKTVGSGGNYGCPYFWKAYEEDLAHITPSDFMRGLLDMERYSDCFALLLDFRWIRTYVLNDPGHVYSLASDGYFALLSALRRWNRSGSSGFEIDDLEFLRLVGNACRMMEPFIFGSRNVEVLATQFYGRLLGAKSNIAPMAVLLRSIRTHASRDGAWFRPLNTCGFDEPMTDVHRSVRAEDATVVAISGDGTWFASAGGPGTRFRGNKAPKYEIHVWRVKPDTGESTQISGESMNFLTGHTREVTNLCISPSGCFLVSSCAGIEPGCLTVWEGMQSWIMAPHGVAKIPRQHDLQAVDSYITSLAISADSRKLCVSFQALLFVKMWVLGGGRPALVGEIRNDGNDIPHNVAWSPCGEFLAFVTSDCRDIGLRVRGGKSGVGPSCVRVWRISFDGQKTEVCRFEAYTPSDWHGDGNSDLRNHSATGHDESDDLNALHDRIVRYLCISFLESSSDRVTLAAGGDGAWCGSESARHSDVRGLVEILEVQRSQQVRGESWYPRRERVMSDGGTMGRVTAVRTAHRKSGHVIFTASDDGLIRAWLSGPRGFIRGAENCVLPLGPASNVMKRRLAFGRGQSKSGSYFVATCMGVSADGGKVLSGSSDRYVIHVWNVDDYGDYGHALSRASSLWQSEFPYAVADHEPVGTVPGPLNKDLCSYFELQRGFMNSWYRATQVMTQTADCVELEVPSDPHAVSGVTRCSKRMHAMFFDWARVGFGDTRMTVAAGVFAQQIHKEVVASVDGVSSGGDRERGSEGCSCRRGCAIRFGDSRVAVLELEESTPWKLAVAKQAEQALQVVPVGHAG